MKKKWWGVSWKAFWGGLWLWWWIACVSYQPSAVDVGGANKVVLCFKSDSITLLMVVLQNGLGFPAHAADTHS